MNMKQALWIPILHIREKNKFLYIINILKKLVKKINKYKKNLNYCRIINSKINNIKKIKNVLF